MGGETLQEIKTEELLERIGCADAGELNEIMAALTERFRELWSDWDLLLVSCEGRTPQAHIKALEQGIRITAAASGNNATR